MPTYTNTTYDPWPTWTSTGAGLVFAARNVTYTLTSGSTTSTPVWEVWTDTGTGAATNAIYTTWLEYAEHHERLAVPRRIPAKPSEAEVRAALAREKRLREADLAQALAVKAAREKAARLLEDHLTEEQVAHLRARDCFYLETLGQDGKKNRYRIDRGTHGNVKRVDEKGSILESLCIQPGGVPTEDAMLAQKLWLETDEAAFRRVANITRRP
jgi:hypothetical protein